MLIQVWTYNLVTSFSKRLYLLCRLWFYTWVVHVFFKGAMPHCVAIPGVSSSLVRKRTTAVYAYCKGVNEFSHTLCPPLHSVVTLVSSKRIHFPGDIKVVYLIFFAPDHNHSWPVDKLPVSFFLLDFILLGKGWKCKLTSACIHCTGWSHHLLHLIINLLNLMPTSKSACV